MAGCLTHRLGVLAQAGAPSTYLRTTLGNKDYTAPSSTSTSNGWAVKITTPAGASTVLSSVWVALTSVSGTASFKALLMTDSGGSPSGTILAIGNATTPSAVASEVAVEMPFASDQTLSASTDYWIGFVPDGTIGLVTADTNFSNTQGYEVAVTYSSPTWNAAGDTLSSRAAVWCVAKQAATITGTHQQGSTSLFAAANQMRIGLPAHAIGDLIVLDTGQWFGTVPTISGFTEISNQQVHTFSGMRHRILTRTIDGTEGGVVYIPSPSGNDRTVVATVLRGGGAIEGTAHNTNTGTSITTSAVTTSGSNRRVFNFCTFGQGNAGATNTESADGWTDVYSLGTTFSADYSHSLSYKDVAAAGSSGTETRTVSNCYWHTTSWAKPDV